MNRKEAIVVGISIFAILTGTVFAETNSPNTQASATTLQTVGIDIPILKIVPGIGQGSSFQAIPIYNVPTDSPPLLNLTTAFSFAPPKGFVRVTSAALKHTSGSSHGRRDICWNPTSHGNTPRS